MSYYSDDWLTILLGDCRAVMAAMEPESVQTVVTSPPYWGLRDYGTEGQLGLEPTPEAYVAAMVEVFREVRRVLRSDGTVWLNLGDSYARDPGKGQKFAGGTFVGSDTNGGRTDVRTEVPTGLKPKDLVGIPWRVAFALQADGWYLRSDIIWSKPNPMPESVTDRPTKSHEYLFLLAKSPRYYFDNEAVRLDVSPNWKPGAGAPMPELGDHRREDGARGHQAQRVYDIAKGANIRSVWTVATQPYPGAHFATFPPKLIEPCIKAGCPVQSCSECGAPWERIVERGQALKSGGGNTQGHAEGPMNRNGHGQWDAGAIVTMRTSETTGWRPTCAHDAATVPGVVLDPFAGSGTTGLVANRLGRRAVLIDLNADYLGQVMERAVEGVPYPLGLETA